MTLGVGNNKLIKIINKEGSQDSQKTRELTSRDENPRIHKS